MGGIAVSLVDSESRSELVSFVDLYLARVGTGPMGLEEGNLQGFVLQEVLKGAALPWLLGLSLVGAPAVLALLFLRGFALGFTVVFLFEQLSYRGLLLAFVGILPQTMLGVPGLLLAAGAAITFAVGASKVLSGRRVDGSVYSQLATATLLTLCASVLIALSCWIQGNVSPILVETLVGYIRA